MKILIMLFNEPKKIFDYVLSIYGLILSVAIQESINIIIGILSALILIIRLLVIIKKEFFTLIKKQQNEV